MHAGSSDGVICLINYSYDIEFSISPYKNKTEGSSMISIEENL